ncbi:unnamed protein product [Closterium sp. NIES-65]|nr:unnamed protein product [Closterium sp. NIES-65]
MRQRAVYYFRCASEIIISGPRQLRRTAEILSEWPRRIARRWMRWRLACRAHSMRCSPLPRCSWRLLLPLLVVVRTQVRSEAQAGVQKPGGWSKRKKMSSAQQGTGSNSEFSLSPFPTAILLRVSPHLQDTARHRLLSESLVDEARGAAIDTSAVGAAGGEGEVQMMLGATRLEQISKAVRAMVQDQQHRHALKS